MNSRQNVAHLTCQLNNQKHGVEHTVYISSDPAQNELTLVLSTDADEAHFTTGSLVPKHQASQGSGSLLYLKLTSLPLSDAEFARLQVTADGWHSQNFSDAHDRMVCLTPTAPLSLKRNASLTFTLKNFTLATAPPPGAVTLALFAWRVSPVTRSEHTDEFVTHCGVAVLPPPETHNLSLYDALHVTTDIAKIVNTVDVQHPLYNRLHLNFQAQGITRQQIPVDANTQFTLSFVYGEDGAGYGALATVKEAQGFTVTPGSRAADTWQVTPMLNAQSPSWILRPTGTTLLGNDDFEFEIEKVSTKFQPGPTALYVQYRGVPGYQNGVYTLPLEKVPQVTVPLFKADPELPQVDANGQAAVTLTWTADDATILTLDWRTAQPRSTNHRSPRLLPSGDQPTPPIPVTGRSSYPLTIRERTEFILTAEGEKPDNLVDNRVIAHCTVGIKPMIRTFEIVPLNDPSHTAFSITWDVLGPQGTVVKLSSNGSFQGRDLPGLSGSLSSVTIDGTQILTLTAIPPTGAPIVELDWEVPPVWQHTEIGTLLFTGIDRALGLANFLNEIARETPVGHPAPEITNTLKKLGLSTVEYIFWTRRELESIPKEEGRFRQILADVGWEVIVPEIAEQVKSIQTHFEATTAFAARSDAERQTWVSAVQAQIPGALEQIHNVIVAASHPLLARCAEKINSLQNVSTSPRFLVLNYLRYLIGLQLQGNVALLNALVWNGSVDDQKKAIRSMKLRYDLQAENFAEVVRNSSNVYRNDAPPPYQDTNWARYFVLGQFEAPAGTCIVGVKFPLYMDGLNCPYIAVAPVDSLFVDEAPQATWIPMPESSRVDVGHMTDITLDLTPIEVPVGGVVTGFGTRLVGGNRLSLSLRPARITEAGLVQGDWISNDATDHVSPQLPERDPIGNFYINANEVKPTPLRPPTGVALYANMGGMNVATLPGDPNTWEILFHRWRKQIPENPFQISFDVHGYIFWIADPPEMRVPTGATVTWCNMSEEVRSIQVGDRRTASIAPKASASLKFVKPGEYPYCIMWENKSDSVKFRLVVT